jgi:hypothetical protein
MQPKKFHIRLFLRCCAKTFYADNLEVYMGKTADNAYHQSKGSESFRQYGLSTTSVLRNCTDIFDEPLGARIIFTDNWYTSPLLFCKLLDHNLYAVGTCKTNRKGFPKKTIMRKKRNAERGECKRHYNKGLHMLATSWFDSKPVHLISTAGGAHLDDISRRLKNGEKVNVKGPACVALYQQGMGGVDKFDF